jgi:hypothetical protein
MKMRSVGFSLVILLLGTCSAAAVCPSPITGKDASGTTQNLGTVVDGSGNCWGGVALVDGTAAANKAAVSSAGGLFTNVTQWASGTLGAMANYGSTPGAVLVPGVNAFITNAPAVTQSGNWTARIVGNTGTVLDGTAGTPSTGVVTVQGVSGGQTIPVTASQATAANLNATVVGTGTFAVQAALAASQNTLGNVGGLNKRVCYNPTVTNGTYGANVVMGGLFTAASLFTSTGSGVIQSVELNFTTAQTVAFKLYYFEANPNNSTWTDHSAAAINATDSLVVGGYVSLANPDSGLGANDTNYSAIGLGITYTPSSTSGYFILVPTATTASLGATTNAFNLCVSVLQNG